MVVAVVLGHRMKNNGQPSDIMLKRMQLTMEMYNQLHPDKIILSGGLANRRAGITEAQFMYDHLLSQGIAADVLVKEEKSVTTWHNAKFSVPIAKQLGATKLVVVTSVEHMSRFYLNPLAFFRSRLKGSQIKLYGYCCK